ncbi:MAG: hypothetical protein CSA11_11195 [Chloroflexi bacterium]|nr:MAG: hypothetical protein CSB13_12215 [Chloroflexota bacterium]PIE79672.1 MAG: hypothetical protein CSA11_11195 [Chloroflexota bacterium]
MNYLWIDTFGTLQLRNQKVTVSHFPTQHAKELLAFLLLHPHIKHNRLKVISLLWPECAEDKGRGRLNTELWRVRTLFKKVGLAPETILQTDRESITFSPNSIIKIDYEQFKMLVNQGIKELDPEKKELIFSKIIGLYKGDFCEDIFTDWCIIERERLSRMYLSVLGSLMRCALDRKSYQETIAYGETILRLDPLREEVHRALILCFANLGLFSKAAKQFHLCSQLLWEELRILPLPETVALFDKLLIERYHTHTNFPPQKENQEELRQTYLHYQEVSARLSQLMESAGAL